ncbi:Phosphohistidine phosphatase SixA [Alkalispirochaeta americana]|uniref:Phosphohistidine phosphatase SixA n=1 Tax=Alkalispirochaeta americana TaxID=159291 RepID=A0A1N6PC14_9SPIO|nr:histidine phosphatase family protein [Alkalispirochaeta americana]SIQ01854.1 Phosphohistidine phosphatase SixA [Alkalispirochaeta americana]
MKYLTLLRHAEAERGGLACPDEARPLTEAGIGDARHLGGVLRNLGPPPQAVYTSNALRTRETVVHLLAAWPGISLEPEAEPDLYLAEASTIWDVAYSALLQWDHVWICAHNPGITESVEHLCGNRIEQFPPAGVVRMVFEDLLPTGTNGSLLLYHAPDVGCVRNHSSPGGVA